MRPRRGLRWLGLAMTLVTVGGCGDPTGGGAGVPARKPEARTKPVMFVGFDASGPLVEALAKGEIQGLVLQDPYRMGQLTIRTLVNELEKKPIERKISTGEVIATSDNMGEEAIHKLLHPPRDRSRSGNASGAKAKQWRVMMIPKGLTHEHWQAVHAGALKAAEELGNVEVIWLAPEKESDRSQQVQLVLAAIGTGVDGIALAPLDSMALVDPVQRAVAKGIPVVIFDSALESEKPVSYVATDNYHGGVLAARRLGQVTGGEGRILMMRYQENSASTQERERGFEETIAKEFPKLTFVSKDQFAGATADTAQRMAQNLVTRYRGQVDAVFCPNESSTFGMLRALQDARMVKPKPKS